MKINADLIYMLLSKSITFAVYKKPGSVELNCVISDPNFIGDSSDKFTYYPFDKNLHPVVELSNCIAEINKKHSTLQEYLETKSPISNSKSDEQDIISNERYLDSLNGVIQELKKGAVQKMVLSRIIDFNGRIDQVKTFMNLCHKHPNSMVHLIQFENQNKDHGFHNWIGASPEILIEKKNGLFHTMSLAGTIKIQEDKNWSEKEKREQDIVTQFISDQLESKNSKNINISDREELIHGSLKHLCNRIQFESSDSIQSLALALHPTPAVCGLPMMESKKLIQNIETHDRQYYTGFLGIENKNDQIYFVNLRCMQVFANSGHLFVGGGITHDSKPEDECEETINKSHTLLSSIVPL